MMNITLLLTMTLAAGTAQAQPATTAETAIAHTDTRFALWLGCWRLEDDLVGTGARLCITPEEPGGVKLQTFLAARLGIDEVIVPDGTTRPITDPNCTGTERSEWSSDSLRVFRYTDVTCGTDPARKVSSISFLSSGPSWINVQYVEGGANRSVRVQRYRRAADQKLADGSRAPEPSARMVAEAPRPNGQDWDVADVIEATGKLPADAVQAAISEGRGPFDLNKKTLAAMADANVAEPVVDLMIALTFPRRFVVERVGGGGSFPPMGISMGGGVYDPFLTSFGYPMMNDCYGMGYRSYYSTCGSAYGPYGNYYGSNFGYYGYPNYGGGGWVVVPNPQQPGTPSVEGRAVNGRGYTQVRPRDPEPSSRTGGVGNGSAPGGSNGGTNGVSSQGYSGGSSGSGSSGSGSGVRTAVPRPPGE